MTKKLAGQKLGRERRAVDGDEFSLRAWTQFVNRMGRKFLTGAALALHKHSGARGSDLFNGVENLHHRGRSADHAIDAELILNLRAELLVFAVGVAFAEGALDENFESVDIHRLRDKIVSSTLHSLHGGIHRSISSHHDADRRVCLFDNPFDERHAIIPAESQVGEHDIHRHALQSRQGTIGIRRDINLKLGIQRMAETVAGIFFVINNEQRCGHCRE